MVLQELEKTKELHQAEVVREKASVKRGLLLSLEKERERVRDLEHELKLQREREQSKHREEKRKLNYALERAERRAKEAEQDLQLEQQEVTRLRKREDERAKRREVMVAGAQAEQQESMHELQLSLQHARQRISDLEDQLVADRQAHEEALKVEAMRARQLEEIVKEEQEAADQEARVRRWLYVAVRAAC